MSKDPDSGRTESEGGASQYLVKDPELFARNLAMMIEQAGKAAAAWTAPREKSEPAITEPMADMVKTMSKLTEYWLADPSRALDAQTRLFSGYLDMWSRALQRIGGQGLQPPAEEAPPARPDKRFQDPEWNRNAFFDFLRQAYLVTSRWAADLAENADGLDELTRRKARFYVKQITNAASPANFVLTNPELLRETVESHGENLVRGMKMLAEDIAAGGGELRLRQTDAGAFQVGRNIAVSKGKVVGRSALAEIIQYAPSTKTVFKRPLLISPPWINKYYILDLNSKKSFIRWAVEQGHTVFVISWVNPDGRHGDKGWEAYIREGLEFGLDVIEQQTGEREVNAVGYCVGGTLLALALARMAREKDKRIRTATFLTTQVDFTYSGDLKVFIDEEQIAGIEKAMSTTGYLAANRMATAFNLLRSGELIWPYVVNNYIKGKEPLPFDLLYWNADSTRLTAANHSFYLRRCYLDNDIAEGRVELDGHPALLSDITIPIYTLATRDDHIAPAKSVFVGARRFGGDVEYVLAGSGHIAGVVNPPSAGKYQYWTGGKVEGDFETWLAGAVEHSGSWWPHWQKWMKAHNPRRVPAREPGAGGGALEDAPGTYVLVKS